MLKRPNLDDAGIVDQDVDLAESVDDAPHSRPNLLSIEQIAFNRQHDSVVRGQIGFGTGEFLRVARNEGDVAASRANVPRQNESKPARSTGDEDNFFTYGVARRSNETG